MVTKEMRQRGRVCAELDYDTYKRIAGRIRSNLPQHIYASPERVTNKEGRKIVRLWCTHPKIGEAAVKRALGE